MSEKNRRSRVSASQPSTSRRHRSSFTEEEDERIASSQAELDDTLSKEEFAHNLANVVKYILVAGQGKGTIVKSTISKATNCTKNFKGVMKQAEETLLDVFGYKMVELEVGKYMLFNTIPNDLPHLEFKQDVSNRYVLLFLILSHIFMNGESCTEDSLLNFFLRLNIIREGYLVSDDFGGNILDIINDDFVKEKYIEVDKSEISDIEYKWGIRAKYEISPRNILEFISKVYGGKDIQTWTEQYQLMKKREEQGF